MATNSRTGVSKPGLKAPRRHAHFWQPLNIWWRSYLADKGRRPVTTEVQQWFNEFADGVWGDAKPSWKEARIHAKCLRSTEQVKNYFREYRARAKGVEYKDETRLAGRDSHQHQDIKVECQEGQQPLAGRSSHRLASVTSDLPPGSPASGPSSSDFALEPVPYSLPEGKGPDPAAISIPASMSMGTGNPMTVTTGNGVPPTWQQRSASERFPPSVRAQLGPPGQEQQPWDRSRSSMIFQPPSSAPQPTKPLSPFILTQSKKDPADPAPGSLRMPGSPMLSIGSKAQSFSCSSKRRHTNEDTFPPHPSSPSFLRHAASFSHGSFNQPHAYTPSLVYGVPVDNTPSCQQPEASAQKLEDAASFYAHPAPPSNPQTFRYPVSSAQRPPKAPAGYELHASEWDRAPCAFSPLGAEEPEAQPRPQQLLGNMDRQLVSDIARDAAVRSSMIEQAASSGGRLREVQRSSSALLPPTGQACSDGGFSHAYAAAAAMQQQPTPDAADADIADFWDLADREQVPGAADVGDAFAMLSGPQFPGMPNLCQPSTRDQQAQQQQVVRQRVAWRARHHLQQCPAGPPRSPGGASDPGGIGRLRAVSYPMAALCPPLSAQALGRPAASSRLDPAHHARPPVGKVLSAARPISAQQESQAQIQARSHQHMGLAHPFRTCTDRGGPSGSISADRWGGNQNPNQNQNQNQPPRAAFQQRHQQLLPPPGQSTSNSNPSGSSSHNPHSSSRQDGVPAAAAQHELKQDVGQLAKSDSLGLPFQALRVHSAALAPITDQGNAGEPWTQQEWSHMEWEGRYEHSQGLEQGLEGPQAPL